MSGKKTKDDDYVSTDIDAYDDGCDSRTLVVTGVVRKSSARIEPSSIS